MKLWLVRHGETEANVAGLYSGHAPTPLTERGMMQARTLGQLLQAVTFDRVLCSELERTHITADLEDICDYLVGLDHGVLAFQGEKDEVLDAFRVVQGPSELLTAETRELFLGWEQSALGFTALTDRPAEAEVLLGQEARYRRPTIEELIIYRGGNVQ